MKEHIDVHSIPVSIQNTLNEQFLSILQEYNFCESEDGLRHREEIIQFLWSLANKWLRETLKQNGVSPSIYETAQCLFVPYGSYALGICSPSSDIDVACMVPNALTTESFFTDFYSMLKKEKRVSRILAVTNAFVPIISIGIDGISADIPIIVIQPLEYSIPDNFHYSDPSLFGSLSLDSIRSLQGPCTTEKLLSIISNQDVFRQALCILKLFAKQRGIYRNVNGFFGGINLSIMLTYLLEKHPDYSLSQLLIDFFNVFHSFNWSSYLSLGPIEHHTELECDRLVWNPTQGGRECMVLLTPSYPSINSMRSATVSSRDVIVEELNRGWTVCCGVLENSIDLIRLFDRLDFCLVYPYYIQIQITSENECSWHDWLGWCDSKLRVFTVYLESIEGVRAIVGDVANDDESRPYSAFRYIGLSLSAALEKQEKITLSQPLNSFIDILRCNQEKGDTISLKILRRDELELIPAVQYEMDD